MRVVWNTERQAPDKLPELSKEPPTGNALDIFSERTASAFEYHAQLKFAPQKEVDEWPDYIVDDHRN